MRARIWARIQRPDLGDLQGNVLQGYGHPCAHYAFLTVTDAGAARGWLGRQATAVQDARPWDRRPPTTINVALTAAGLRALECDRTVLDGLPDEFAQGMGRRARHVLGDRGASDPHHWERGLGTGAAHVLATVHADRGEALAQAVGALHDDLARSGLEPCFEQAAAVLDGAREHFGFTDGFAQPSIRNVRYAGRQPKGNGVPLRWGRWRRLALGEFVLGYVDEDRVRPHAPPGALGRNSTFGVWRKLHQDVALWRSWLLEQADGDPQEATRLAARMVGRWQDGSPLVLAPHEPDPDVAADPRARNGFRYGRDPDGVACPLGAHVRRANPRDAHGFGHRLSFRHRLLRRGMPYGSPLAEGAPDDPDPDRGLVFVAYNASIARQFEVVQGSWCATGRGVGLGRDPDPLIGDELETAKHTIQSRPPQPPRFLAPLRSFVTCRGGEYLLLPGRSGLRALGTGREAAERV